MTEQNRQRAIRLFVAVLAFTGGAVCVCGGDAVSAVSSGRRGNDRGIGTNISFVLNFSKALYTDGVLEYTKHMI
ncbi:MAG: hypothetical protein HFF44_04770 [Lawsonibacter sp.]|nr:hypothetical protein [Lawsonibacter sp.]